MDCFSHLRKNAIPIHVVEVRTFNQWLKEQNPFIKNWMRTTQFVPEPFATRLIADQTGKLKSIICCVLDKHNFWEVAGLPLILPELLYYFIDFEENYALAWGLGAYQFIKYRQPKRKSAKLVVPKSQAITSIKEMIESIYLVRDLINTPTEDMGPTELADVARALASTQGAKFTEISGEKLIKQNYPCIYTVGKASNDAPRLLDFRWGNKKHPKVTLVGKGVCFDSGGLDIKSSSNMLLMKKDMGGAAHILGLARMIMTEKLPISLRVLIPAVENVISGNAYKPGDIIKSRKGLTIEIGNTDAEGRLILADALTEAASENPALIVDIATLTGAARVALGTELPAFFANQDELANELIQIGKREYDLMWRLPLFTPYRESLVSYLADINNCSVDPFGGAITAALFLKEFVPDSIPWVHFDLMAWNVRNKPGRPMGGDAFAIRALFAYFKERFVS